MVTVLTSALELFDRINLYGQIVHERTQYLTGATARVDHLIKPLLQYEFIKSEIKAFYQLTECERTSEISQLSYP